MNDFLENRLIEPMGISQEKVVFLEAIFCYLQEFADSIWF